MEDSNTTTSNQVKVIRRNAVNLEQAKALKRSRRGATVMKEVCVNPGVCENCKLFCAVTIVALAGDNNTIPGFKLCRECETVLN